MSERSKSDAIIARAVQRAGAEMAREYAEQRASDAERLHEGFMAVIEGQRPNVEVLVFVLRLLEHQTLEQKAAELFGQAGTPASIPHHHAQDILTRVVSFGHTASGVNGDLAAAPLR